MPGKIFITGFLFLMGAFVLFAVLFGLYPPAANAWWTLLLLAAYIAIAVIVLRRVAKT